jgi:hypothetical protein
MAQPIRRPVAAVRDYADTLHALMDQVRRDPLNESKSVALIAHIVANRASTAHLYRILEDRHAGALC